MNNPHLSILIPAYNEAERIPAALLDMDKRLRVIEFSYELIVVDDGSSDRTIEIVRGMVDRIKNLRILVLDKNQGKGAAVRAGMLEARGDIRMFTDADNSTTIDQFDMMMPFLKVGYGIVIGSRAIKGAVLEPAEPWHRRIAGRGLNFIVQLLLLPGISDTQCGFKAFTAEAAERIFSDSNINGWGFDVEVLSLARILGYRIKEVPVRWVNDTRTHVKPSAGFEFLRDIIKIRWRLLSGRYTQNNYEQENT